MNDIPCGKCKFYDPMLGPKGKDTKRGWCSMRSKYPTNENPGQIFPPGVRRAKLGMISNPYIVESFETLAACTYAVQTEQDTVALKRYAQRNAQNKDYVDKKGKRINT